MAVTARNTARTILASARPEPDAAWPREADAAGSSLPGDAIRLLAAGAASGAPAARLRLPLALADVVAVLWTTLLKFDAADPAWPDRDRFVLSDDQGALLQSALLRLTCRPPSGQPPPGQAAPGQAALSPPAIEAAGFLNGHGLASAIGMALAERMLAARFGRSLVDHRTWVVASEPDLAGGLSHEAISLAGDLRLGRLAVLYDAGDAPVSDLAKRFHAAGWAMRDIDGHDTAAITGALSFALRSRRPSLICCRSHDPDRAAAHAVRPHRVGADVAGLPEALAAHWADSGQRGAPARRAWLKRLAQHPQRADFERAQAGRRPEEWRDALAVLRQDTGGATPGLGTRHASRRTLDTLMESIPELLRCTLDPSRTGPAVPAVVGHDAYRARRLGFGRREHGMAAAMNGIALHGGWLPVGRTGAAGADGLRPALRQAAAMHRQVIHVVTQDGPAHQPAEHPASLRALANLLVFRPADAVETTQCWELALRRADGPSVIFVADQAVPKLARIGPDSHTARGAYVVVEPAEPRAATLIATGPEVGIALQARAALEADGLPVAVVSLPCWELFALQDDDYRARVLGSAPRIGIEAACGFGWERWLGTEGHFIGLPDVAAHAAHAPPDGHFGITRDTVIDAVKARAIDRKTR